MHAWRHEHWARLDAATRRALLRRGLDAFAELGITPCGFRPPGGSLPLEALHEFRSAGLSYCSPLGMLGGSVTQDGVAVLPFVWRHIDAYQLDPDLSSLRERFGDKSAPISVEDWEAVLDGAVAHALEHRTHVTMIFHPYLLARDERMVAALQGLLHALERKPDLWVASCGEVADWLLSTRHS